MITTNQVRQNKTRGRSVIAAPSLAILFALTSSIFFLLTVQPALCQDAQPDKNTLAAQKAFDKGQYRTAEKAWLKVLSALESDETKDQSYALCLKRLGQTYAQMGYLPQSEQYLKRAMNAYQDLGTPDTEIVDSLNELYKTYRPVEIDGLGKDAVDALKKATYTTMGLFKTDKGSKIQIELPDKLEQDLDNDAVDKISLEKKVSIDISEDADGTVKLSNIKGLKVHAKSPNLWVTLIESMIKPADPDGNREAAVTAGKMGIEKTVSTKMPPEAFAPIAGILSQIKAFGTALLTPPAAFAKPTSSTTPPDASSAATSTTSSTSPTTSATPTTSTTTNSYSSTSADYRPTNSSTTELTPTYGTVTTTETRIQRIDTKSGQNSNSATEQGSSTTSPDSSNQATPDSTTGSAAQESTVAPSPVPNP